MLWPLALVVVGGVNLRDKYHVDNPSTIKHFVIWPNAAFLNCRESSLKYGIRALMRFSIMLMVYLSGAEEKMCNSRRNFSNSIALPSLASSVKISDLRVEVFCVEQNSRCCSVTYQILFSLIYIQMSEDVICEYSSKGTKVFGVKIVIVLLFLFTFLLQFTLVKTRLKMNFSADREYDRPRGPRSLKKKSQNSWQPSY